MTDPGRRPTPPATRPATRPTTRAGARPSATAEDYLKAIYRLADRGGASTGEVAQRLRVAPASVSGMLRRLAAQGLVGHTPWRGFVLTAAGRRAALRTIRRHRIVETYLVQVLGVAPDQVHEEAERLEHAASDDVVDRMAGVLGDPAIDPHGAPIPGRHDVGFHRAS